MTTMASNLCRLVVVVLVCAPGLTMSSYPVFGTKRYGRSTTLPRRRVSAWGVPAAPLPIQRAPAHYYPSEGVVSYPYAEEYLDDYYYYPQDYPYYPAAAYSPAVSYYHQHPGYSYYGYEEATDPVDDLQEEMQEEEREERGESLPIGQETWFETGSRQQAHRDSFADVNAAFLQNLILSQAYDESSAHRQTPRFGTYDDEESAEDEEGDWTYGDVVREGTAYDGYYPVEDPEDEEVRELKSLAKKARRQGRYHDQGWIQEDAYRKRASQQARGRTQEPRGEYASWVPAAGSSITFTDRKVPARTTQAPATTTTTSSSTAAPTANPQVEARRGQKEVPLLRPATPVRRPALQARSHPSSVYDTLKQLLSMEKDLRKNPASSRPHKRFVTPDEGLVKELSGLKKLAV